MNPGPIEEAGQTARSVIGALHSQPLVLGLLLVNVLFIVLVYFSVRDNTLQRNEIIRDLTRLVAACPAAVEAPK